MSLGRTLQREARVALSRTAQSLRFRIVKWILTVAAIAWLWPSPYFWWIAGGAPSVSIGLHLFWRYKTKGWTQPWFGWDDVDTANKD